MNVAEYAGHRQSRSDGPLKGSLTELRLLREQARQTILREFPDKEVPLDDLYGVVIAIDGKPRKFQQFWDLRPDMKKHPKYGTPEERKRYARFQQLLLAHHNADMAIDVYKRLLEEHPDAADGIELLASGCLNAAESFANQFRTLLDQSSTSERNRRHAYARYSQASDNRLSAEEWPHVKAELERRELNDQNQMGAAAEISSLLSLGKFPGIVRKVKVSPKTIVNKRL